MAKVSYWKDIDVLNIELKKGKFKFTVPQKSADLLSESEVEKSD